MKIGINILFLKPGIAGGTETYTIGLLQALAKIQDTNNVFYLYCGSDFDTGFLENNPNFVIVKFNRVTRSLAYRYFFEQFIFPFKLKKYKLDVLHSLGYVGPVFNRHHIVTIHDTNAFSHKQAMPFLKRILLSFFLKVIARNCMHIIAVSNFSKQEITGHLKVAASKITVVYEACKFTDNVISQQTLPAKFSALAITPYFAALTSVSPHKNILTLLKAFKQLEKDAPNAQLVLIGHMPADNSIQQYIIDERPTNKAIVTGFVDDTTLISLLKNALCFVFPSLYEGFGLPLLEAQALKVPVIASNMASLPEIGGDSAIYFPATDANALAQVMFNLLNNNEQRNKYIAKGIENVKRFSWDKTAKETLALYYAKTLDA